MPQPFTTCYESNCGPAGWSQAVWAALRQVPWLAAAVILMPEVCSEGITERMSGPHF